MPGEMGEDGCVSPLLHLDLHNFEEPSSGRSRYVLTSPRSLEACARQGLRPVQLLRKPLKDFLSEHPDTSLLGAVRLYETNEKQRRRNLRRCQQERQILLQEEKKQEVTPPSSIPVPSCRFTDEDPEYGREIQKSEEWLRGPSSFTHWGEVPDRGDGWQQLATVAAEARRSWSSGDLSTGGSAACRKALQLARDIERETRVSLPPKDRKIAALMLARHQQERERQEKGLQAAQAWEEQKSLEKGRRTRALLEKSKLQAQREKRYHEYLVQEKENADWRKQQPQDKMERARLLEERRRIQPAHEDWKTRHRHLKQRADEQLQAMGEKLRKSQGAYELLMEERTKELKERAARGEEQMSLAKRRAGMREQQQRQRKELLLERTNQKIQQARESVIRLVQEKGERAREINALKGQAHGRLKQRIEEQAEYCRREMEYMIKLKERKSDQILREKEASLEESRKIARASFQMRERVREQINSRPFNQMVLAAQLNASLIK